MANQLDIDVSTVFDNLDEHQFEFSGEVDGNEYQFAVKYGLLEAISGEAPVGDAGALFNQYVDVIHDASLAALPRDTDAEIITVSESDLDQ